ncbi:hypothetical protein [Streptosporangium sp. NPDC000396]|uniref:hypothetical protein n=1 Tax=Streptosporangium sp. NPDC000396 TaxID=3366185 RepID=UPI00369925E4
MVDFILRRGILLRRAALGCSRSGSLLFAFFVGELEDFYGGIGILWAGCPGRGRRTGALAGVGVNFTSDGSAGSCDRDFGFDPHPSRVRRCHVLSWSNGLLGMLRALCPGGAELCGINRSAPPSMKRLSQQGFHVLAMKKCRPAKMFGAQALTGNMRISTLAMSGKLHGSGR